MPSKISAIPLRLHDPLLKMVDAHAAETKLSRHAALVHLIKLGFEHIPLLASKMRDPRANEGVNHPLAATAKSSQQSQARARPDLSMVPVIDRTRWRACPKLGKGKK